jgi:hypothetical protein
MNDQSVLDTALTAVRAYAESHPRPSHVTQKQGAEMLDISQQTMGKLVRRGVFKLNKVGMIPIHQIDRALVSD